jgi:hypothetical protein
MLAGLATSRSRPMVRKMTFRGHGSVVGGTRNHIPPPPIEGGNPLQHSVWA